MNEKKVFLITGCSSGIGYQLVTSLKDVEHFKIYATSQDTENLKNIECESVVVKKLNVSSENEIAAVVDDILQTEGHIDVLVYSAGIGYCCPVESISTDDAKNVLNINTIGMMSLTAKVLPSMKKRAKGHILAVSAMCGIIGFPFNSIYSASKFAVEGYCESLREEVKDFYIDVTLVEPGPVSTDQRRIEQMADKDIDLTTKRLYETYLQKNDDSYQTMGQTPEDVAAQIKQIIIEQKPQQLRHFTNPIYANALSQVYREKVSSCG